MLRNYPNKTALAGCIQLIMQARLQLFLPGGIALITGIMVCGYLQPDFSLLFSSPIILSVLAVADGTMPEFANECLHAALITGCIARYSRIPINPGIEAESGRKDLSQGDPTASGRIFKVILMKNINFYSTKGVSGLTGPSPVPGMNPVYIFVRRAFADHAPAVNESYRNGFDGY
ncbi:hypothetical protein [Chitinophaga rhizophila]|uniref:Uncharacterized protein n=1 Tax=Chitinophaga rhizophila TaxID=2866212 RepID=A0ABS7GHR0_9BACT|nr:hypothetical protein [Chitinophaga rhizophila]MBW8686309.1 hypothetical protein [Chitinophaga rhizophila]